ncbi:MAG: hypothetical protein PVH31_00385 [Ectothiorhodospiraceae bacterium]|jgi:hypothetical protein
MTASSETVRRGRWQVIALAVLFFGPAILAWVMVWTGWRPMATVNNGELLQPPQKVQLAGWQSRDGAELTAADFAGHWTLLAVEGGTCAEECLARLDALLRVRVALDKDAGRVRIMLLQPDGTPAPEFPKRGLVQSATAPWSVLRPLLTVDGETLASEVHLIDYRGFRMMRYPIPLDASGMLDDMERLLRLSNEDLEHYLERNPSDVER